jgi:membrane protease subunit HflK
MMVTGDQNIVDLDFTVFWKIKNAEAYLFNIRNPEATVKAVAESAMREVIGQTTLQQALTGGRAQIEQRTRDSMQQILDVYKAGILISEVRLLSVDPPKQVIDAFNEVQRARQDKDRKQNEADAYRNRIVPTARGDAARIVQEAEAYKTRVLKDAEGEAKRFTAVYNSYVAAKDITERRIYLETMEEILRGTQKVIVDQGAKGTGVVPYLPLPELRKPAPAPAAKAPAEGARK